MKLMTFNLEHEISNINSKINKYKRKINKFDHIVNVKGVRFQVDAEPEKPRFNED